MFSSVPGDYGTQTDEPGNTETRNNSQAIDAATGALTFRRSRVAKRERAAVAKPRALVSGVPPFRLQHHYPFLV